MSLIKPFFVIVGCLCQISGLGNRSVKTTDIFKFYALFNLLSKRNQSILKSNLEISEQLKQRLETTNKQHKLVSFSFHHSISAAIQKSIHTSE